MGYVVIVFAVLLGALIGALHPALVVLVIFYAARKMQKSESLLCCCTTRPGEERRLIAFGRVIG